ncbi:MAG: guanylate kinase [Sphingomonadaceae bacterium]|nr:guanylate kinase [Sphingomonadaceae bacterium]
MLVLSSPSGAGKTTISRKLLDADQQIRMSVSVTTRPMRPGEVDGKDYHFTTREEFDRMVEAGEFLEYAEVFGNHYGTPRAQIEQGLESGQDFLFDIDWQGTQTLRQEMGDDVVPVFLLPPSVDELRQRLTSRSTDSTDVINARMERARDEISHWDAYGYVLINDDIDECFGQVGQILSAERLRRERQTGLIEFARELMKPEG